MLVATVVCEPTNNRSHSISKDVALRPRGHNMLHELAVGHGNQGAGQAADDWEGEHLGIVSHDFTKAACDGVALDE